MKQVIAAVATVFLTVAGTSLADGDVGLLNEKHPVENLTISGQPTLEQLQAVKEAGYTTVINLRRDGEFDDFDEAAEVDKLGMTYVHIPVKNVASITAEDVSRLNDALENASGPVLLHCTVGRRAGSIWAIEQYLYQGATEEEAIELVSEAHMDHAAGDVEEWIEENGSR
ncbi:MAG: protein tyrosine phosphatase family protein [Woeseiaceae bacterium]